METCRNVGFELWQARKAKGWTRAQASAITKLRIGQLEAIESNDFQALPPVGYLRKHLRDYVHELGLEQDFVARYVEQFQPMAGEEELAPVASPIASLRSHLLAPLRRVALIAILVLVGWFFFNPSTRFIDITQDTVAATVAPEPDVNASYGAVMETTRSIATSSRLAQ